MKPSERLRELADHVNNNGNKCRPRDPVLSASLRNLARDLRKLADDVAALEAAVAEAFDLETSF